MTSISSNHTYIVKEGILHANYTNLYYINNDFYYLTLKDNVKLKKIKTLNGPEHTGRIHQNIYTICPKIKYFENKELLYKFVNELNYKEIIENTLYFSHYYEHNIAHGLYDSLYPIYTAFIYFFDECKYKPVNIFLNVLVDKYWRSPSNFTATREWVLNVFKEFCNGGEMIIQNSCYVNLKFNSLIVGANRGGISSTNNMGIMPGKNVNGLEKFRNRFFKIYNIIKQKRNNINILFINNTRYIQEGKKTLEQLMKYYKSKNYSVKYLDWKDINSFKEQLTIMNETDIQISSAGTGMLNFPFLNDNSININLGVKNYAPHNKPTLLETNICLLSNKIYTDFYDIYKYKEVKYEPLKNMLDDNINNILQNKILTTKIPFYTQKWRELCVKENMAGIINKMNMDGSGTQKDIANRFPDVWLVI